MGSSSIKAALGEVISPGNVNILGLSQVVSVGLRKGNIVDIENTARSIDQCLNELERLTGIEIASALSGFSGISLTAVHNHAVIAVGNPNDEITEEDKQRVLQSARNIALPPDKIIVQVIERQYIVDGYDGVKDPVGMMGSRLEAEVVIIIAAAAAVQNLQRCSNRINLQLERLVYSPLLMAESVLMPAEKEMGVALVDMGGGTTEISLFEQGSLSSTAVLPIGGEYITRDLAIVLRTSIEEASRIKEEAGVASTTLARSDITVNVRNIQGNELKQVSQHVIAEIVGARVLEMVEMIQAELNQNTCIDNLPGGLVISGGGAQLTGIAEMMESYLNIPVRLGVPDNIKGLQREYNQPQNSVVLGCICYGANLIDLAATDNYQGMSNILARINYWLKDLFG
ncbi:Cell division protein FtsA [Syntrophomonas zehnderi OL-4]|uniref:Cell division protein FtsA n=1 Tax=Syntrophomonas zehnderi OL-4 TaxID=690567 RepID=A0A0E4GAP8_9FIRM|nr:cell division protein FtsA [Syntrophomonas zehnderi]CFX63328.1 Cell division protein FtsA [Syntrophomonas zehnderi OL-4]